MSLLLLFNQRTIYDKSLSDAVSLVDNTTIEFQASIAFQHGISDTVLLIDEDRKQITTTLADVISFADVLIRDIGKHNADFISASDALVKDFNKSYEDVLTLIDTYVKAVEIPQTDSISFTDILSALFNANYLKELYDIVIFSDTDNKDVSAVLESILSITEDISNEPEVIIDETISITDDHTKEPNIQLFDSLSLIEETLLLFNQNILKALLDSVSFSDAISEKQSGISIADLLTLTDSTKKQPNIILTDDGFMFADVTVKRFEKDLFDVVTIAEYLSKRHGIDLSLTDAFAFIDSPDQYHPGPIILETITANGLITIIIEKPSTVAVITYTTTWTADSLITTNIVFQSKIA